MAKQELTVTYRPTGKDTERKLRAAAKKLGITVNKFIDRAVIEQIVRHARLMPQRDRYELLKIATKYDGDRQYHETMIYAIQELWRLEFQEGFGRKKK